MSKYYEGKPWQIKNPTKATLLLSISVNVQIL
jgi:hypothetical protein